MSLAVQEPVSTVSAHKLRSWIPTLIWLCVLAFFSTDTFSAEHTGSLLLRILHALFGTRFDEQFEQVHFLIRKAAHFCSYGFLGALAFFSWRATLPARPRWILRWSLLALMVAVIAGSLDEFHQIFVPSRGPSLRDVLIDTMGGIFFQLAIALWIGWRDKRIRRAGCDVSSPKSLYFLQVLGKISNSGSKLLHLTRLSHSWRQE